MPKAILCEIVNPDGTPAQSAGTSPYAWMLQWEVQAANEHLEHIGDIRRWRVLGGSR